MSTREDIPGWEGSIGPSPAQYRDPHVYARDIQSGAGNCVCGASLPDPLHVAAAPGIPIPPDMRIRLAARIRRDTQTAIPDRDRA